MTGLAYYSNPGHGNASWESILLGNLSRRPDRLGHPVADTKEAAMNSRSYRVTMGHTCCACVLRTR